MSAILCIGFGILTAAVALGVARRLDYAIYAAVPRPAASTALHMVSLTASIYAAIVYIAVALVIYRDARSRLAFTLGFLSAMLAAYALKALLNVPRPTSAYLGPSYPSGHATRAGFVAAWVSWGKRRWSHVAVLTWAAVVAYSRVALGAHWPSDVIGGLLLGACIARIARLLAC